MKTIHLTIMVILIIICNISTTFAQPCEPSNKTFANVTNDVISYRDIGYVATMTYKWCLPQGGDPKGYIVLDWDNLSHHDPRLSLKAVKDLVTNHLIRKYTNITGSNDITWRVYFTTECYTKVICTINALLFSAFTCCDDNAFKENGLAELAYSVPPNLTASYIDLSKDVQCGKKCCYADFDIKRKIYTDGPSDIEYLAITRLQEQGPGVEVYGCPTSSITHCVKKNPMGQPLNIPCGANCNVR